MADGVKPNDPSNAAKADGQVVEVEAMNQPREMSIVEAAARVGQKRAELAEKLRRIDIALVEINRICRSGQYTSYPIILSQQRTLCRRREMYSRNINSLDTYSNMLDEASLSLEEAEITSDMKSIQGVVESAQRNVKRKLESWTS